MHEQRILERRQRLDEVQAAVLRRITERTETAQARGEERLEAAEDRVEEQLQIIKVQGKFEASLASATSMAQGSIGWKDRHAKHIRKMEEAVNRLREMIDTRKEKQ